MAARNYKAFIVEGELREPQILENLQKIHFKNSNFIIITIPAGQNIYMLWKKMKEDDFDTDIIEVLRESSDFLGESLEGLSREDFSEIYLFFDYDGHQRNLSALDDLASTEVIEQMLRNFDNETENGRLYISYPMAEALRDYIPDCCGNENECYCFFDDSGSYKRVSAERSRNPEFKKYTYSHWKDIINVFAMRISCLFGWKEPISYEFYQREVTPYAIFEVQRRNIVNQKVFILSAFPEFLLDYFPKRFWNACLIHTTIQPKSCSRQ